MRDELDAADAARERALRALQVEHLRLKSGMEKRVAAAEAAEATGEKTSRHRREARTRDEGTERRARETYDEGERGTKARGRRGTTIARTRRRRRRRRENREAEATRRTDAEQRPADDSDADGDAPGDENADANRNDGEYRRGGTNAHETATPPEGHPAITPFDPSRFRSTSHRDVDLANTREEREERDGFGDAGETARRSGEVNFDDVKNADVDAEVSAGVQTPRASISASPRASASLEVYATVAAKEKASKFSSTSAAAVPEPSYPEPIATRLRRLEDRAAARDTHWRSVLNEVQKAHAADAAGLRRQCARAVEAKNVQIRHFREKLNRLIAAMHEQSLRDSATRGDDRAAAATASSPRGERK